MRSNQWWKQYALGAACTTLFLGACAMDSSEAPEAEDDGDAELGAVDQEAIVNGCTAAKLTAPTAGFQVGVGVLLTLTATSTCPVGVTPEYQYWAKETSAKNWTIVNAAFVPGSLTTWSIPWTGAWSLSAAVRGVGSPARYEARSAAVNGTAIPFNRNPEPGDDDITTTANLAGSVDVLANDSDPDGETVSLTGHGEPLSGSLAFVGSVATYTPGQGFVGTDSFTYTVSDGVGGSATGTVNIQVTDQAPVANPDTLLATVNGTGSVNVLTNDSDPDGDLLTVTEFTQGAHGAVTFLAGVATYTPAIGYAGTDEFTYTIDDGHAMTAIGTVNVTVSNPVPGCSISISGPVSGIYAQNLPLIASAACNTGPAQVQWYHRVSSGYVIVQAWSTVHTLDYAADLVGSNLFYALVRTQGAKSSQGKSNTLSIPVADNVPQCSAVKMVTPTANQALSTGFAQTLTASSTCQVGGTAEYQFWVKAAAARNWTQLPGYTTGSGSWTPVETGAWQVKAVVRSVGAHVTYQAGSSARSVTVVSGP